MSLHLHIDLRPMNWAETTFADCQFVIDSDLTLIVCKVIKSAFLRNIKYKFRITVTTHKKSIFNAE